MRGTTSLYNYEDMGREELLAACFGLETVLSLKEEQLDNANKQCEYIMSLYYDMEEQLVQTQLRLSHYGKSAHPQVKSTESQTVDDDLKVAKDRNGFEMAGNRQKADSDRGYKTGSVVAEDRNGFGIAQSGQKADGDRDYKMDSVVDELKLNEHYELKDMKGSEDLNGFGMARNGHKAHGDQGYRTDSVADELKLDEHDSKFPNEALQNVDDELRITTDPREILFVHSSQERPVTVLEMPKTKPDSGRKDATFLSTSGEGGVHDDSMAGYSSDYEVDESATEEADPDVSLTEPDVNQNRKSFECFTVEFATKTPQSQKSPRSPMKHSSPRHYEPDRYKDNGKSRQKIPEKAASKSPTPRKKTKTSKDKVRMSEQHKNSKFDSVATALFHSFSTPRSKGNAADRDLNTPVAKDSEKSDFKSQKSLSKSAIMDTNKHGKNSPRSKEVTMVTDLRSSRSKVTDKDTQRSEVVSKDTEVPQLRKETYEIDEMQSVIKHINEGANPAQSTNGKHALFRDLDLLESDMDLRKELTVHQSKNLEEDSNPDPPRSLKSAMEFRSSDRRILDDLSRPSTASSPARVRRRQKSVDSPRKPLLSTFSHGQSSENEGTADKDTGLSNTWSGSGLKDSLEQINKEEKPKEQVTPKQKPPLPRPQSAKGLRPKAEDSLTPRLRPRSKSRDRKPKKQQQQQHLLRQSWHSVCTGVGDGLPQGGTSQHDPIFSTHQKVPTQHAGLVDSLEL